ncbi:MAG: hypothetical protein IJV26_10655 [Lachnospiraceae bacterium]|nr:hypothetical protein [Lachnospiraceae bacterium]
MYNVLIQSHTTQSSFDRFYPIFSEEIQAGRLSVCQWIESGTTVRSALPELYDLIGKKNKWRAIIVSTEFRDREGEHLTDSLNPYDYLENAELEEMPLGADGRFVESPIPLIRLTHLLGGIPLPEVQVTQEDEADEALAALRAQESERRREAYIRWSEENVLEAVPPEEIILIQARRGRTDASDYIDLEEAWKQQDIFQPSLFWLRNTYPSICRFLTFDVDLHGVLSTQRDLFKMWSALLLMCKNRLPSDTMQAYRLYKLDLEIDTDKMEKKFQSVAGQLNQAKYQLRRDLRGQENMSRIIDPDLPAYEVGIPVSFNRTDASSFAVSFENYGLAAGEGGSDFIRWAEEVDQGNRGLKKLVHLLNRVLDQCSGRVRESTFMTEQELPVLTEYQQEDLQESMNDSYSAVLRVHEQLAFDKEGIEEELAQTDKEIKTLIIRRMSKKTALTVGMILPLALLCSLLPGILSSLNFRAAGIYLTFGMIFTALTVLLILSLRRRRMINTMKDYQRTLLEYVHRILAHEPAYSEFLSGIASYIRGKRILDAAARRRKQAESIRSLRLGHLKTIEAFLEKLESWSAAFHLDVDTRESDVIRLEDEDQLELSELETLYEFTEEKGQSAEINHSGKQIPSPFGFIRRLLIQREEIYDTFDED